MKKTMIALALAAFAGGASAAGNCTVSADEKKLSGAARASFMKKCESDARATCEKGAADRKLAGAAKDANIKKCVADAVGTS